MTDNEPKTRWDVRWNPMVPSCYDCCYYDEGTEHGDYGSLLSCDPGCLWSDIGYGNPCFPFRIVPLRCITGGKFQPDLFTLFFKSAFANDFDGTDESLKSAMAGFIFMLENIGMVGL
jgi:hypothetical protein